MDDLDDNSAAAEKSKIPAVKSSDEHCTSSGGSQKACVPNASKAHAEATEITPKVSSLKINESYTACKKNTTGKKKPKEEFFLKDLQTGRLRELLV